jgi:hypothetical protein
MHRSHLSFAAVRKIERRAYRISDPIERLRYLRQATGEGPPAESRPAWRRLASVVLALAVIPLGSDANVRMRTNVKRSRSAIRGTVSQWSYAPDVWLAERTAESELYSNGLRIERRFEIANEPRVYTPVHRDSNKAAGPLLSQPAGIVFHTTEGDQAPFEAEQSQNLNRISRELLQYVRSKRAYHFVIDRFGRVFRVVIESDTANHAGHSLWADSQWVYLDLNAGFLGVAFEARTHTHEQPINPAQLYAGKLLVDMLRNRYRIPPQNCVTHAQVSVNPENMHIGWHTDWGVGFPFQGLGLPDNYACPNPGLSIFGFEYDDNYRKSTSPDLWHGLARAEEQVRISAAEHGMTVSSYRALLQTKYGQTITALRERRQSLEN